MDPKRPKMLLYALDEDDMPRWPASVQMPLRPPEPKMSLQEPKTKKTWMDSRGRECLRGPSGRKCLFDFPEPKVLPWPPGRRMYMRPSSAQNASRVEGQAASAAPKAVILSSKKSWQPAAFCHLCRPFYPAYELRLTFPDFHSALLWALLAITHLERWRKCDPHTPKFWRQPTTPETHQPGSAPGSICDVPPNARHMNVHDHTSRPIAKHVVAPTHTAAPIASTSAAPS